MRILLLGPIHKENEFLKQSGRYPFLRSQAQQSYVQALESLGHTVAVFRYTDSFLISNVLRANFVEYLITYYPTLLGRLKRLHDKLYRFSAENYIKNAVLLRFAEKFKPQVIIFSGGTACIFPSTLHKIKSRFHCPLILLWGINPNISATIPERIIVQKGIVDLVVENDCGYAEIWKKIGAQHVLVLPISSLDPQLHKRVMVTAEEKKEYDCDVCFVGSLTTSRQNVLTSLKRFKLKVWGDIHPGIPLQPSLASHYHGSATGEKMVKIFNAAKIVLNFQPSDMMCGGNMRTFEIPGCGSFQLADKVNQQWFTIGKEIVIFENPKDLLEKIKYYILHEKERKAIADAGYKKAHQLHTYKKHFESLLENISNH